MGLDETQENQAVHDYVHGQPGDAASVRLSSDTFVVHGPKPDNADFDFRAFANQPSPSAMAITRGSPFALYRTLAVLIVLVATSACDQGIVACEDAIKLGLSTPSSYQRIGSEKIPERHRQ